MQKKPLEFRKKAVPCLANNSSPFEKELYLMLGPWWRLTAYPWDNHVTLQTELPNTACKLLGPLQCLQCPIALIIKKKGSTCGKA